jgi:hypothetical protein
VTTMTARPQELQIDPGGLSKAQLDGDACVQCRKVWPAPNRRVGRFPDGRAAMACEDCAQLFPSRR